jgi:hypothetical protein
VRPYVLTRGRTEPLRSVLPLDTRLERGEAGEPMAVGADGPLTPEAARLVDLCVEPTSIAGLAEAIGLPAGVVRVIAGDLLAAERLQLADREDAAPAPVSEADDTDEDERAAG